MKVQTGCIIKNKEQDCRSAELFNSDQDTVSCFGAAGHLLILFSGLHLKEKEKVNYVNTIVSIV